MAGVSDKDFEQAYEVVRTLRRLTMTQRGRRAEMIRRLNLMIGQDILLIELSLRGQASQIELADAAEIDEPSTARSIQRLERDGLVKRSVDPKDARRRVVKLTPAGRRLIPRIKKIYLEFADEAAGPPDEPLRRRILKTVGETAARFRR